MIFTGKHRAVVTDIADPKNLGRIRARLLMEGAMANTLTAWCFPCSPLAGPGYGFYCLPQVGDEVWVEVAEGGVWIWTGFSWRGPITKPADGSATVRVFRTPAGHEVSFDESGDVRVANAGGSAVVLKLNGDVVIEATGNILLGGDGQQLVTADFLQAFSQHLHTSAAAGSPTSPPTIPATTQITDKTRAI